MWRAYRTMKEKLARTMAAKGIPANQYAARKCSRCGTWWGPKTPSEATNNQCNDCTEYANTKTPTPS
jgi:hypothetical protein